MNSKRVGRELVIKIENKYLLYIITFLGKKITNTYINYKNNKFNKLTTIQLWGQHYFYSYTEEEIK